MRAFHQVRWCSGLVRLLFVASLAVSSFVSCEQTGLPVSDRGYREELEHYNYQVRLRREAIETYDRMIQAAAAGGQPEDARRFGEDRRRAEEELRRVLAKREDLKTRVTRALGRLPDWWTEPDR